MCDYILYITLIPTMIGCLSLIKHLYLQKINEPQLITAEYPDIYRPLLQEELLRE